MSFRAHALSVLWWNIGGANFHQTQEAPSYDKAPLEKSLDKIIKDKDPEVLVFGEYYEGFLEPEIFHKIQNHYGHGDFFKYNSHSDIGIAVFSKYPLDIHYEPDVLSWKKGDIKSNLSLKYNELHSTRSFQRITFDYKGQEINLVPYHSVMPWNEIKSDDQGLSSIHSAFGPIEVGLSILFSEKSSLGHQAKILQQKIKAQRFFSKPESTWLLFGDFNIPDSFAYIPSKIFTVLKGDFKQGTLMDGIDYSFPYPNTALGVPQMQIDHALSNKESDQMKYEFLDYPGSDHFPMLMHF